MNGARRQENRWDPTENGQVVPDDKSVGRSLASNAMFKLEHGVKDVGKLKSVSPALANLEGLQERWKDDYLTNKILRNQFRAKKKEIKAEEERDKAFLSKNSLDIPLLKESEDDSRIAGLIRLQPTQTSEERQAERRHQIESRSKFPLSIDASSKDSAEKQEKVEKQRASLGISFPPKRSLTPVSTTTSTSASDSTPPSSNHTCGFPSPSESTSSASNSISSPASTNGLSLICGDYGSSSSDESV
jgi:coiled-coil domain-containing protein 130